MGRFNKHNISFIAFNNFMTVWFYEYIVWQMKGKHRYLKFLIDIVYQNVEKSLKQTKSNVHQLWDHETAILCSTFIKFSHLASYTRLAIHLKASQPQECYLSTRCQ